MRFVLGSALVALLTVPGFARAEEPAPKYTPTTAFEETDTNKDGKIDGQELHERLIEVFYAADVDRDGTLNEVEFGQAIMIPENFPVVDSNADGKASLHEFVRERVEKWRAIDINDDELLTLDEVTSAAAPAPAPAAEGAK